MAADTSGLITEKHFLAPADVSLVSQLEDGFELGNLLFILMYKASEKRWRSAFNGLTETQQLRFQFVDRQGSGGRRVLQRLDEAYSNFCILRLGEHFHQPSQFHRSGSRERIGHDQELAA